MHEMSVAQGIAQAVIKTAEREKAVKVAKINLEIGELTFLNPEQVIFWLAELLKDSVAEEAEIEHMEVRAKVRCEKCSYEGPLDVHEDPLFHRSLPVFTCPWCKKGSLTILEGRDCIVSSIEILTESDIPSRK
ncbi:hydrogenase maturation nickel metallochaperone HypA [candidate division WOR-3 bacterium]|nr:hydrogenase maturation nickel metallochaperone HypA [candidate division WOR-3 bacterium]